MSWMKQLKRSNKYNAEKERVDGILFDSKAEASRYRELKLLEHAGKIKDLKCHTVYPLKVNDVTIWKWEDDFNYWDIENNCKVIEDVKGVYTRTSQAKHKHFHAQYGIPVRVVKVR